MDLCEHLEKKMKGSRSDSIASGKTTD